jgi:hypothetical protein
MTNVARFLLLVFTLLFLKGEQFICETLCSTNFSCETLVRLNPVVRR